MDNNSKVSVPAGKAGAGLGNTTDTVVKTSAGIKGFGSGKMDGSLEGNDAVTKGSGNGKGAIKGFSGSGTKGGKV
jgi:hypothetical protein